MSATFWIEERNKYLKRYYGKMSVDKLAKKLGTTISGIYHQANRLNLKLQNHKRNDIDRKTIKENNEQN